ncbi:MAG TPA: TolC family protein [Gemmatimonadales bacterium]|nr:TolC family protein [Gemmatimonadales bacterium]
MMLRLPVALALGAACLSARPGGAAAQQPSAAPDTLRLGALQNQAVRRDPRGRQTDLLAAQSALRLRSLGTEWLPRFDVAALAQYQSEVATLPFDRPGGEPFALPKDSYDAHLGVRQPIFDPSLGVRRDLERAQLAESQAGVRSTLFALRQSVADAYFTALLLAARSAELGAGVTDLEAQLRVARERVGGGVALPSDTAVLGAELLRRRQSLAELAADRGAALAVLGDLTGRTVGGRDTLVLPDLAGEVAEARTGFEAARQRPEYAQFARTREVLDRRRTEIGRRDWPRLSAVGRAGVGRPGLNPLGDEFGGYWLAGLQLEWSPWDWGRAGRERQALAIQQEIVATEQAAFTEGIRRGVVRDLATVDRLARALEADDAIIALRDGVLRETRLRFGEGVVTSAEFVDRETEALAARLARATHRVELAQARARFLTLIGAEVR